jgi:hypothetical protein
LGTGEKNPRTWYATEYEHVAVDDEPVESVTVLETECPPTELVSNWMVPCAGPTSPEPASLAVQATEAWTPRTSGPVGQVEPKLTSGPALSSLIGPNSVEAVLPASSEAVPFAVWEPFVPNVSSAGQSAMPELVPSVLPTS